MCCGFQNTDKLQEFQEEAMHMQVTLPVIILHNEQFVSLLNCEGQSKCCEPDLLINQAER